jgi:hypothetical protein
MNLFSTLSLYGGGPGSGCNPAVGKCGRPPRGAYELKGALVGDGFYKDGYFYEQDYEKRENHWKQAIRIGLVKRENKDPEEVLNEVLKKGFVRVLHHSGPTSVNLEAWDKSEPNLREAVLRLPDKVNRISVEYWNPHQYFYVKNKEEVLDRIQAGKVLIR